YLTILLLALSIIGFIIILAYKVYGHIGLSVDEIETKVQAGLREVNKLNKEIETTQKEVVFTMGAIGESRSKETGNHVKRVAKYSKILALYYGLDKAEAEMLKQASPMHDIGKVAIADAILNKPGRFNQEEFEIMKTHAELGYKMLNKSQRPLLKMASIVAYEHHEKWDGSGYPQGKKAQDIHIYGRITALADVFDALGSARVYKKAWADDAIFSLIKNERGKHFDPKLVDIFFAHLDEFLSVRAKFKDEF
ncbi:MAG: HD domain-containing protein, partial [Pseudomonadota bacterium]